MSSHYIHGTHPEEQRRLSLMNELLNQSSLRELALRGDEKVIDFGSGLGQFSRVMARALPRGRVIGIERSEEQIASARRMAAADDEEGMVEFRQGDVLALQLPHEDRGTFDLAHTRFLLEHLPDPLVVVKAMVEAVKPGGRIVLADDDHETLRLWPEPPGVLDLWRAYMRTYDRIGNDPFTGRRLVEFLHQAGAQPVRNTLIFFGGCSGMEIFPTLIANVSGILQGARARITSMGLYDDTYIDAVLGGLREWSHRPDAAFWFSMCWAEGRKV
jgi:SAM-dependent methyltransferase